MPRKASNPQQSVPEIVAGASGAGDKKIRTSEPTAVILAGDILRWLIPKVGKFPKSVRFGLGARIESAHLDVLQDLIRAQYETGNDRARALAQANSSLQVARHLWRNGELIRELCDPAHLIGRLHAALPLPPHSAVQSAGGSRGFDRGVR